MLKILAMAVAALGAELRHAKEAIDNEYIVVLKKGLDSNSTAFHKAVMSKASVVISRELSIGNFNAYSVKTGKEGLRALLDANEVDYVEQNGVVRINDCELQRNAPWGLSRIATRISGVTDSDYPHENDFDGKSVVAYVLDTGIYIDHDDFEGRAEWGTNTADTDNDDGNGHGTHCAGTIAGKTYGVSKQSTLVAVKVLNNEGSGSYDGVMDGIKWATDDRKSRNRPGVGSMSLGGGFSQAMNDAVNAAVDEGLPIVVASGNENQDACNVSPASATKAITVNAIQEGDTRASYSNFGSCSDIFAPGSNILSAWITGETSSKSLSGTSMACPHVAGAVAKYLSKFPGASTDDVKAFITSSATLNVVKSPGSNSPNKLLFAHDCETSSPTPAPPTPPTPPTPQPTPPPTSTCASVAPDDRYSCTDRTIVNKAECLKQPDCCWSQMPITAVWCYKAPAN